MTGSAINLEFAYTALALALLLAIAGGVSAVLLLLLRPLLLRHVLARPNQRSSHKVPTPQGGGIAVIAAVVVAAGCVVILVPGLESSARTLGVVMAATIGLAIVGASDDVRPLGAIPRLIDMGVDPFLIAPTLLMSMAQRLVQKLVPNTGKAIPVEGAIAEQLEKEFADLPPVYLQKLPIGNTVYEAQKTDQSESGLHGRVRRQHRQQPVPALVAAALGAQAERAEDVL